MIFSQSASHIGDCHIGDSHTGEKRLNTRADSSSLDSHRQMVWPMTCQLAHPVFPHWSPIHVITEFDVYGQSVLLKPNACRWTELHRTVTLKAHSHEIMNAFANLNCMVTRLISNPFANCSSLLSERAQVWLCDRQQSVLLASELFCYHDCCRLLVWLVELKCYERWMIFR